MIEANKTPELLDSNEYVELGDNHLTFRPDTPFEVWEAVFKRLKNAERAVQWWIGDALRFGEGRYGEMYSQALEETDYSYQSLRNASYVAGAVELSRRRDNLSFSHHAEIASLSPEKQDYWLDKAEPEEGSKKPSMSRNELREHVRDKKRQSQGDNAPPLTTRDLSFREMEEKADAMLQVEEDQKELADNGLELRAVPIREESDEPEPVQKKEPDALEKWNSAMYDIELRLNSIRDMGGIKAIPSAWLPDKKEVLRERLLRMSSTLKGLAYEIGGEE